MLWDSVMEVLKVKEKVNKNELHGRKEIRMKICCNLSRFRNLWKKKSEDLPIMNTNAFWYKVYTEIY